MKNSSLKTSFILLAAGKSSRMKADKALLDFHGESWIHYQVSSIQKSGLIDQIVIVDRLEQKKIYEKQLSQFETIHFVENPNPDSAPADSILKALESFSFPQGAFISPIDVPLSEEILRQIWSQRLAPSRVIKPALGGHGGHPVWIEAKTLLEFQKQPDRLDFFIRNLPSEQVQFVEISDLRTQLNLNTPEDWQKFLSQY